MQHDAKGFIVALEDDLDGDEVADVIRLLKLIRGVVGVRPIDTDVMGDSIQRMRIKNELQRKILDLFK